MVTPVADEVTLLQGHDGTGIFSVNIEAVELVESAEVTADSGEMGVTDDTVSSDDSEVKVVTAAERLVVGNPAIVFSVSVIVDPSVASVMLVAVFPAPPSDVLTVVIVVKVAVGSIHWTLPS